MAPSPSTYKKAAKQFLALREKLPSESTREIQQICRNVVDPRTATAEQAWPVIWDKPLYTNVRIATGDRWVCELRPHMTDAWRYWGKRLEAKVRLDSNVPDKKLAVIKSAATLLKKAAKDKEHPVKCFFDNELEYLVPYLEKELGRGCGPATVLHMLTGFGLAVKPDVHVISTLQHLCLWPENRNTVTGRRQTLEFISIVFAFAKAVGIARANGTVHPKKLRRFDLELMHISKYGLLGGNQVPAGPCR